MDCGKVGAICGVLIDQGDPWTVGKWGQFVAY